MDEWRPSAVCLGAGSIRDGAVTAPSLAGALLDPGESMAQFALRWVIDQPGVSTVIAGARNPEQVRGNAASAALPPLRDEQLAGVQDVYDRLLRPLVHGRW